MVVDQSVRSVTEDIVEHSSELEEEKDTFDTAHEYKAKPKQYYDVVDGRQCRSSSIHTKKVRAIFYKADSDDSGHGPKADGLLDKEELRVFLIQICGGEHGNKFADEVFSHMDADKKGSINFNDMYTYFRRILEKRGALTNAKNIIKQASADDEDGCRSQVDVSGCSSQGEVQAVDVVKKQRKRKRDALKRLFDNVFAKDAAPPAQHKKVVRGVSVVEEKLVDLFHQQTEDDMENLLQNRWKDFVNFKRLGNDDTLVMTSNENASDALPGNYNLNSLIRDQFDMHTTFVAPPHAVIKGVRWEQKTGSQKYGRCVFPEDSWNGQIPVGYGTNQNLSYYGASLVEEDRNDIVNLVYRHVTTDFTYGEDYYDQYVVALGGGTGLERHEFHHIECPLSDDSGHFVLAKFVSEDELHISGFIIPRNHIIHIPENVIHSNDHMRGTWRTMLSDGPDIDLVKFYTEKKITEDGFTKSITWNRLDVKTEWKKSK